MPNLPCLRGATGAGNNGNDYQQGQRTPSPPTTASDYWKLNGQLFAARERAAMKQQMALAAIQRLVNQGIDM